MDSREGASTGVTVIGADAPSTYHVASRTEPAAPPLVGASPLSASAAISLLKKKRGRPRKYGPEGTLNMPFSPLPLSSSAPPCLEFPMGSKRGRGRGSGMEPRQRKSDCFGEWVACQPGANFTPHVVTVNTGEDVTMKILSFSQQGPRATCILSANGVISNVTLRQPDSSGGTLTYEGRFEILSLTGSYAPTIETGGAKGRSGGLSVSLASPDGRVVGGGVAGNLVAASPVQVVVGSFLPSNHQEQKAKLKDSTPATTLPPPASYAPPSSASGEHSAGVVARNGFADFGPPKTTNFDEWSQTARKSTTDINICLPVG